MLPRIQSSTCSREQPVQRESRAIAVSFKCDPTGASIIVRLLEPKLADDALDRAIEPVADRVGFLAESARRLRSRKGPVVRSSETERSLSVRRARTASIKSFQASWVAGPGLGATGSTPLTPGALTATTELWNSGLRARSTTLLIAIRPSRRFNSTDPARSYSPTVTRIRKLAITAWQKSDESATRRSRNNAQPRPHDLPDVRFVRPNKFLGGCRVACPDLFEELLQSAHGYPPQGRHESHSN